MFAEAMVTTGAAVTIFAFVGHAWLRRLAGYHGWTNLVLHAMVLWFFYGSATYGLLQAEASAIMLSGCLWIYRMGWGYERLTARGWKRFAGWWT